MKLTVAFSFLRVFAITLLLHYSSFAQDIHFELIKPPEDVSWQLTTSMSQGPDGFLWLANYTGIYKYDGHQFVHYLHDPKDPNSLADDRVECILAAKDGIVWIGTYVTGLDRFDPATGIFTHFHHAANDPNSISNDTVTALLQDHHGNIWIGSYGGIDLINTQTGSFTHFAHQSNNPASLSNNMVRSLYEDREGIIWVGTGSPFGENAEGSAGGLNRFDPVTHLFTSYRHDPNDPNSISDDRVRAIFEDSKGTLWIGTPGDGLQTLNRKTGVFTHYYFDPANPAKLSRPPVKKVLPYVDDHITYINEDNNGRIWIVTMEGGINVYDPSTKKLEHYGTDNSSREKVVTDQFWAGYKTKDDNLWISTWGASNGVFNLYKISAYEKKLPYINLNKIVGSFAEDSSGTLWLGTSRGLIHIGADGSQEQFLVDRDTASLANAILSLEREKKDQSFWAGTFRGLYHFDPVKKTFTGYRPQAGNPNSLLSDTVTDIHTDPAGEEIWVGGPLGLQLMDSKTRTFLKNFQNDPQDTNSISGNAVYRIIRDRNNQLWVGTRRGIDRFDESTGRFKRYMVTLGRVNAPFEDRDGNLWAASEQGLFKYNKDKDDFLNVSDLIGILTASTGVFWITEGLDSNLWLNTNVGIVKFDPKSNAAVLYGGNQGVVAQVVTTVGYTRKNGEVLYGTLNGYFAFRPEQLMNKLPPPIVNLTKFLLASKPVIPVQGGILTQPLSQATEIRLGHNQNTFSFEFASVDFAGYELGNRLQYMLENYDQSWRIGGDDKIAYYFDVPPGNYIFKVKAINDNGLSQEKSISVIIVPPWWHTWWAYSIFVLVMGGVIWAFILFRSRQLTRENKVLEEKVHHRTSQLQQSIEELRSTQNQLIQSEKMASLGELTAGIAHEIQNPLNFVNNFSEVSTELIDEMDAELKKGEINQARTIATDIRQNLEKINHHGKRADAIVKGMLQHSQRGSSQKEPTDINALADEYIRLCYHGLRAKDKFFNATIQTDFDKAVGTINVVPQDIGRVLLNLCNNAFYAVNEKKKTAGEAYQPTVSVQTKKLKNIVEIRIIDNGNGITPKVLDKIFQPFFTTKPTGQGTGLGLSLSYDIIKAHGGDIQVETEVGTGTSFIIHLPT